jgi:predicted RNA binding protein with dsRBD fold (UPF0201 family)
MRSLNRREAEEADIATFVGGACAALASLQEYLQKQSITDLA